MPAYTIRIVPATCDQEGCDRRATQEVHRGDNTLFGRYCDKHAAAALKRAGPGEAR